jgi:uncharacterized Zn finger protein (UPF0148 family)
MSRGVPTRELSNPLGSPPMKRFERYLKPCPECETAGALIIDDHFGTLVLFCPACEHGWTAQERRHRERRKDSAATAEERRKAFRR